MKNDFFQNLMFPSRELCRTASTEKGRAEKYARRLLRKFKEFGYVEKIENGQIKGWFIHRGAAPTCLVSIGSAQFLSTPEWQERQDVQTQYPDAPLETGFTITIPSGFYSKLGRVRLSDISVRMGKERVKFSPDLKALFEEYWAVSGVSQEVSSTRGAVFQNGLMLDVRQEIPQTTRAVSLRVGDTTYESVWLSVAAGTGARQAKSTIELPPRIWDHLDGRAEVSVTVLVDGKVIGDAVVRVREAVQAFWSLKFWAQGDSLEILLGLEHGRYLVRHTEFPPQLLDYLVSMARTYDCLDYVTEFFPTPPQDMFVDGPSLSEAELQLRNARHEMQRAFLDGEDITAELFKKVAKQFGLDTDYTNKLVERWISNMCRAGQFDRIADLLDDDYIDLLIEAENAHTVTMALPFLVWKGRIEDAVDVLEELDELPGWVNTECIFAASVLQARVALDQDEDFTFLKALLEYLGEIRGQYWSRLYDRHMLSSLLPWLERMHSLPASVRRRLVDATLKTVSLSHDFWQALPEMDHSCAQTARLYKARDVFHTLSKCLFEPLGPEQLKQALEAAKLFRSFGNLGAEAVIKELLLHAEQQGWAETVDLEMELAMLETPDLLRFAAFPGTSSAVDRFSHSEIKDLIQGAAVLRSKQAVSRYHALQALNGARISSFGETSMLSDADLDVIVEDALALNVEKTGWLSADVLSRMAEQAADRDLRAKLLTGANDALEQARNAGLSVDDFPALQVAERRLSRLDKGRDVSTHPVPPGPSDTLVVIYSCQKNLDDRIPPLRRTWVEDLKARGIPYVVLVGNGDDRWEDDVLYLDVADTYEALPAKSLKMAEWIFENTDYEYLLKVDDDCYFSVDQFFDTMSYRKYHYYGRVISRGIGDTSRTWHHTKASGKADEQRLDRSPEPSRYCDGSTGYTLSRHGMKMLGEARKTGAGRRIISASYFEDKLVGDLLELMNISPVGEDYLTHILRKTEGGETPVTTYQNSFLPSRCSPINMVHLDEVKSLDRMHAHASTDLLTPQKIWPTHVPPSLGYNTQLLEFISDPERLTRLKSAEMVLVAVMRNEMRLLPHFLSHYRALGVESFLIADNLSDDGTREYLLGQEDVVLYSADSEYRDSHYGVDWQQALLGNHCIGKWVLLVDTDEFLTFPGVKDKSLADLTQSLSAGGYDGARAMLIDMYPEGPLSECDLSQGSPFELAPYHDDPPVRRVLGSGKFSNTEKQFVSNLRHRLMPSAEEALFMAVKFPLIKYSPLMRLSEGIHFIGNLNISPEDLTLAHFKYHAEFSDKVVREIKRAQHFNGGIEYKKYGAMLERTGGTLFEEGISRALDADLMPESYPGVINVKEEGVRDGD